jgi:hypothetical protein
MRKTTPRTKKSIDGPRYHTTDKAQWTQFKEGLKQLDDDAHWRFLEMQDISPLGGDRSELRRKTLARD